MPEELLPRGDLRHPVKNQDLTSLRNPLSLGFLGTKGNLKSKEHDQMVCKKLALFVTFSPYLSYAILASTVTVPGSWG